MSRCGVSVVVLFVLLIGSVSAALSKAYVGSRLERKGDEIVVAGQLFHTGVPVILCTSVISVDLRYSEEKPSLQPRYFLFSPRYLEDWKAFLLCILLSFVGTDEGGYDAYRTELRFSPYNISSYNTYSNMPSSEVRSMLADNQIVCAHARLTTASMNCASHWGCCLVH